MPAACRPVTGHMRLVFQRDALSTHPSYGTKIQKKIFPAEKKAMILHGFHSKARAKSDTINSIVY
jgi:hypothetical protein